MHWRRFRIADIPTNDEALFSDWLLARWREKDDLLQYYVENNRFPADQGLTPSVNGGEPSKGAGWIETEVRPEKWYEWVQVFVPVAAVGLLINVLLKIVHMALSIAKLK
jgi:lysocardiolipin and lysophospholipid acyltransferase